MRRGVRSRRIGRPLGPLMGSIDRFPELFHHSDTAEIVTSAAARGDLSHAPTFSSSENFPFLAISLRWLFTLRPSFGERTCAADRRQCIGKSVLEQTQERTCTRITLADFAISSQCQVLTCFVDGVRGIPNN